MVFLCLPMGRLGYSEVMMHSDGGAGGGSVSNGCDRHVGAGSGAGGGPLRFSK